MSHTICSKCTIVYHADYFSKPFELISSMRRHSWLVIIMVAVTFTIFGMIIGNYGLGIYNGPISWSNWSEFGDCSYSLTAAACVKTRTRECINGSPGDQGCHIGEQFEQQACIKTECLLELIGECLFAFLVGILTYLYIKVHKMLNKNEHEKNEREKNRKAKSIHAHRENTS